RQFAGRPAAQGFSPECEGGRNLPPRRRDRAAGEKEARDGCGLRCPHGHTAGCVRRHQGHAAAARARGPLVARYLLDTNICFYIRRNDPPKVRKRFEQLGPEEAAISIITYGELAYGAARHPDPP